MSKQKALCFEEMSRNDSICRGGIDRGEYRDKFVKFSINVSFIINTMKQFESYLHRHQVNKCHSVVCHVTIEAFAPPHITYVHKQS